ncbi:uncharacterized protein EI90DRAFT_3056743 [Cantharellus anzutake]|uniref:uncharacterized protein n=1 Tax=Cantharellus anzutake TaxID=1750568 RepID=UPI0019039DC9|nr:uncharacterized protein EI90DRAFT_3056743 [Cantharellus anzutake]KAF8331638.1 hypothetical protein EI90DRAFT_3056743 [Cantharellus anzutake]
MVIRSNRWPMSEIAKLSTPTMACLPLFQTTIASLIFFPSFRTLLLTMSSCTLPTKTWPVIRPLS